jgi:deazaflavin-dependent oxidoreductase (nitroreductase family)
MSPNGRKLSPPEKLGRALSTTRVGVYVFRYIFTPLDKVTYRITKGRRGLSPKSMSTALLTTTGRKSGREVTTPVLLLPDGSDHIVVGSNYGRGRHPAWTYNLIARPQATVQMGPRTFDVDAVRLTQEEAGSYWLRLVAMWPGWTTYRSITDREFRMFRLRPKDEISAS